MKKHFVLVLRNVNEKINLVKADIRALEVEVTLASGIIQSEEKEVVEATKRIDDLWRKTKPGQELTEQITTLLEKVPS